ncbi:MAG: zf-HC2 domain-containing protein [Candidatus Aminicenantaceae bacterium]
MKKCGYEVLIDDYLLNRLEESKKIEFEKHLFNCDGCFEKTKERNELIAVIKNNGYQLFQEYIEESKEKAKFTLPERIINFFSPKQWSFVLASAALLFVVILTINPSYITESPQTKLDDEVLRGQSIIPRYPEGHIKNIPDTFVWKKVGEDTEYKIDLYGHDNNLLWKGSSFKNEISLPQKIKNLLKKGQSYWWQVKAFSHRGLFITSSPLQKFKIMDKSPSETEKNHH